MCSCSSACTPAARRFRLITPPPPSMSRPADGQSREGKRPFSLFLTHQLTCILFVGVPCCFPESGISCGGVPDTQPPSRVHLLCRHCKKTIHVEKKAREKNSAAGPIHLNCMYDERKAGETGQKRAHSPSAEQQIVARRRMEQSSLLDLTPEQLKMFQSNGFLRLKGTEKSRAIAWKIIARRPRSGGEIIAGKVKQQDVASDSALAEALEEWNVLLLSIVKELGIESSESPPLYMVDPKILVAKPGSGLQSVHWDGARDAESAGKFSGLLFCSNGHLGTAMPTFPADDRLSFSNIPEEMNAVVHLLGREHYLSEPAQPGDIIFFRQSTSHFGVKNESTKDDRVVLFSMLSPSSAENQDEQQTFPWGFIGHASGWDSLAFALSLVDGRESSPLARMIPAHRKAARACLKHHGLLQQYDVLTGANP
jgi:hypothetical protein